MEFNGTKSYVTTKDLTVAVNASISLKTFVGKREPGD